MTTLNANPIFQAGGAFITAIKEQNNVIYAVLQNGLIYKLGTGLFLNISNDVLNSGEMGLLGLAFHPINTNRFYLWYSEFPNNPPAGFDHVNRLEGWQIVGGVPQRLVTYLRIPSVSSVHNGLNNIYYDAAAKRLILATGEGGSSILAQDDNQLAGKVISINVNATSIWAGGGNNNPITMVSQLGAFSSVISVVAKGIRNPTRIDEKSGIKFLSVAGQSNREFAFAFRNFNKNFGWRAFEGPLATVSGTTVSFPSEVNLLLQQNTVWKPNISYANAGAAGLTPAIIRGSAITGIDYYTANTIPALTNNMIYIDLSGQLFQSVVLQSPSEIVLQLSQKTNKITVNNLPGIYTTMYITNNGRLLVANALTSGPIVAKISELTA